MNRTVPELQIAAARLLRSVIPRPEHRVAEMNALLVEAWESGRDFERAARAVVQAAHRCRYCGYPLVPAGPRPDWAAAVEGYPFPAMFCAKRGEDAPVHEPEPAEEAAL